MDNFQKQTKFFTIASRLLIVSTISMLAIIPAIYLDKSPNSMPVQAAIGALIGMFIHLIVFFGFLRGIRVSKSQRKVNNEINLVAAFACLVLGLMISDGATALMDQVIFASVGMFLVVLCDLVAAIVLVTAFIMLRKRKKKKPA